MSRAAFPQSFFRALGLFVWRSASIVACVSFSESYFSVGIAEALFFLDHANVSAELFFEGGTGDTCIPVLLLDSALGRRLNFLFLCPLTLFGRPHFPFLAGVDSNGNASVAIIVYGIIKIMYAPCGVIIRGFLVAGAS